MSELYHDIVCHALFPRTLNKKQQDCQHCESMAFVLFVIMNGDHLIAITNNVTHAITSSFEVFFFLFSCEHRAFYFRLNIHFCILLFLFFGVHSTLVEGICWHAVDLNRAHWPMRVLNRRFWIKVMELGMEVGRTLWVGSHWKLWKTVTRGQPSTWHLWSANHCPNFLGSKAASFLSLFRVTLLKFDLASLTWNNKIFDSLPIFFLLKFSFDTGSSENVHIETT